MGLRGDSRWFPFEDIAVACKWTDIAEAHAPIHQDLFDLKPIFPLDEILGKVDGSRKELVENLIDSKFVQVLDDTAAQFKKKLFKVDS